ncbi:lck-interacting transmembrane adapter 1 [Vicugna pacos]|uniref:Lck-interacting transmembrane adapter 1 n=1 Tax=Vicugna pacos TaxID=30538 RepID=A0ABM5BWD3_VICPA
MRQRAQEDWHSHCPPRKGCASSSEADQSLRCPPCSLNHRWVEPLLPRWEETGQAPGVLAAQEPGFSPRAGRPQDHPVPVLCLVCPPHRGWRQPTASSQDSAGSQRTPTRYCRDPRRGRGRWLRLQRGAEWLCGETQPDAQAGSEVGAGLRAAQRHHASRCPGCLLPQTAEEACASALAFPRLCRMRPQVPLAPPALWVLGCLTFLLWLWVLCSACHRKRVPRQLSRLQDSVMPVEGSLMRRPYHHSLSKSDTRLHELHRSRPCNRAPAPRPASMDLLCPQWPEVSRGTNRPPAAFSHLELPLAAPSTSPEATYSNVGLAAIPRASLAVSPGVWTGSWLTSSCARPGPAARPVVAEYACIQKFKGTDRGPQGLELGKAELTPATQVDLLYSRVSKPKRRDPGPATCQPNPNGGGAVLALRGDSAYEVLPLRGLGVDKSLLENVYESIQEMGASVHLEPSSSSS